MMGISVACIAVAKVVHHLFEGEFVGGKFVHIGLRALLPDLHLQLIFGKLVFET